MALPRPQRRQQQRVQDRMNTRMAAPGQNMDPAKVAQRMQQRTGMQMPKPKKPAQQQPGGRPELRPLPMPVGGGGAARAPVGMTDFQGKEFAAGQDRQDARQDFRQRQRYEGRNTFTDPVMGTDYTRERPMGDLQGRDIYIPQQLFDRFYLPPGAQHDERMNLANPQNAWVLGEIRRLNPHLQGVEDIRIMDQFRRVIGRPETAGGAIQPGEFQTFSGPGELLQFDPNQAQARRPAPGQGGTGGAGLPTGGGGGFGGFPTGGGTPVTEGPGMGAFPPPAGNVPGIGTGGVTEQGDEFSFENDPILGGRIDELLSGMESVQDTELRGMLGNALSGILMNDPQADPNVVLDRLANVREQMIPLRESAKTRVATDLARMGLADSPQIMAQALAGVESEINNQITQRWREVVDEESSRANERFMQGIQLGQNQEESDRAYKLQQMDTALKRAGIEAQERLDLIRLANDARQVFNSGRQIDANIALDNLKYNLAFQQFLHTQGMDLANFQLAVEQARTGNALDLQRLLLQYMGNLQQGYI